MKEEDTEKNGDNDSYSDENSLNNKQGEKLEGIRE